jgi:ATP-binding cassette subfamily C (CFTR/MRP) protein 4
MEKIKKSKKHGSPSLLKVLIATFWPEYLGLGIILVVMDLLVRLTQPMMLGKLLDHFRPNSTVDKTAALWYAGAIVGLNALSALLINQYIMRAFHYGMKVRAACCALIYRKVIFFSIHLTQWMIDMLIRKTYSLRSRLSNLFYLFL